MMLQVNRTAVRPATRGSVNRAFSTPRLSVRAAAHTKQQAAEPSPGLPLAWAGVLLSSTPLAAWADEAAAPVEAAAESVQQAAAAATEAAAEVAPTPTWLSYIVVLTPIILYGIFNWYRSQVNPRIKFSDFLFICAGVAVVANLVSIIGFKVRLF